MKACAQCGSEKPLADFPRAPTCVDGARSYCKSCQKERRAPQRAAVKDRDYELHKAWVAANRDRTREIKCEYRKRATASGLAAKMSARCRAAKPEMYRAAVSARRRALRTAMPPWADMGQIRKIYELAQRIGLTVDHVIPIRGANVCGLHVPWNLQLLTASENSSKSASFREPSFEEVVAWAQKKTPIDE